MKILFDIVNNVILSAVSIASFVFTITFAADDCNRKGKLLPIEIISQPLDTRFLFAFNLACRPFWSS